MTTAVHLSTDNSKIKVRSSLRMPYSSEGVSTLNVDSEVEFLKPLRSTLQSDKVQEAKMAVFLALSMACSLIEGNASLKKYLGPYTD